MELVGMDNLRYVVKNNSLSHAYESRYVDKRASVSKRNINGYANTKPIIGRTSSTPTKYVRYQGNYKSRYYDPVARHERYLRERSSLGIGKGLSGSGGSRKGLGSSNDSGKGSGVSKKVGAGSRANLASEIQKLREEGQLYTDVQREAARRKIKDLQNRLSEQIKKLRGEAYKDAQNETKQMMIRGITQNLRSRIENLRNSSSEDSKKLSKQLQEWISNEKDSLERRMATLYKSKGLKYTPQLQKDKASSSEARDKEVKSRADSIYKSKTTKK